MQSQDLMLPHEYYKGQDTACESSHPPEIVALDQVYQAKCEHIASTINTGADGLVNSTCRIHSRTPYAKKAMQLMNKIEKPTQISC